MEEPRLARQGEQAAVVRRQEELLSKAAAELVEREFGPHGLPKGVQFAELEQLSVELGDGLARRIMARAVSGQVRWNGPNRNAPAGTVAGLFSLRAVNWGWTARSTARPCSRR